MTARVIPFPSRQKLHPAAMFGCKCGGAILVAAIDDQTHIAHKGHTECEFNSASLEAQLSGVASALVKQLQQLLPLVSDENYNVQISEKSS